MQPEEFFDAVRKGMTSSNYDLDRNGFSMTVEGGRWTISRPRSAYDNDAVSVSSTHFGEGTLKTALETLRKWATRDRYTQALVAAHDWLYGSRDGVDRPYLVDTAILKHFERNGVGRDQFAELVRLQLGHRPGVAEIVKRMDHVYSSFPEYARPQAFDAYCWRSRTHRLHSGFAPLGGIQFRLAGNAGWGLWAYFEFMPGVFWCGGPSPAIWIADQQLPDTLMLGCKGRHVTDLVGHPALEVEGLTVHGLKRERGRVTISVKAVRERLGQPARLAKAA